jgi:hypothetical protein
MLGIVAAKEIIKYTVFASGYAKDCRNYTLKSSQSALIRFTKNAHILASLRSLDQLGRKLPHAESLPSVGAKKNPLLRGG